MNLSKSLHTPLLDTVFCPVHHQWQLEVLCGNCGWGSLSSQRVNLPILPGKKPPVPVNSWAVLHELQVWGVLTVAQWYWGQETEMAPPEPLFYFSVANHRSTWIIVGMSKYIPCAPSGLMSANCPPIFFDNLLHSYCHQFSLNIPHICSSHQASAIHIRNYGPFTIGLVDPSPNVAFMVVA